MPVKDDIIIFKSWFEYPLGGYLISDNLKSKTRSERPQEWKKNYQTRNYENSMKKNQSQSLLYFITEQVEDSPSEVSILKIILTIRR